MSLKLVNLGLPKSGTTTLAEALRRVGMHVVDHRFGRRDLPNPGLRRMFVAEALYRGYFRTGNPAAILDGVDAISEMSMLRTGKSLWPQMDFALIAALKDHNPNVKFIATWRAPAEVSRSMLAWSNLGTTRIPDTDIPGLPIGYGQTAKEREQWISGHYRSLRRFFSGRDDFMECDITAPDIQQRLGAFIGCDLPWWGRLNANPLTEDMTAGSEF
ncbi:MAG: hypothetical protein ACU0BB_08350 [Paracoccaceae bacterium]